LIIGENPGAVDSPYFYDMTRSVRVRRNLLKGLESCGLISSQTLEAFKTGGFLFDHAIRCPLPVAEVKREWRRARRYESLRTANAAHLLSSIKDFQYVWIMGYIARNAAALLDKQFPRHIRGLDIPYIASGSKPYFVSRYLLNVGDAEVAKICERFKIFCSAQSLGKL
jgi:hypothetical protein